LQENVKASQKGGHPEKYRGKNLLVIREQYCGKGKRAYNTRNRRKHLKEFRINLRKSKRPQEKPKGRNQRKIANQKNIHKHGKITKKKSGGRFTRFKEINREKKVFWTAEHVLAQRRGDVGGKKGGSKE